MTTQPPTNDTIKLVLIILAVLLTGPMLMMLAFPLMGMWGGGMMAGYGDYGMYGGSALVGVGMSLFWLVILVGGGYLGYKWLTSTDSHGSDSALEELRLAYARGEITDEEFEQRRSKLRNE